ncbi:MAG: sugar phosphate nucleotidyltransferase [Patescibacteria group bacterium]
MKTVILAAGFGSRLWPLSTSERPKQFQQLLGEQSLLQYTYALLKHIVPAEDLYVLTLRGHEPLVAEQLPELEADHVFTVPERRNTLPHTIYALNMLFHSRGAPDDQPVLFCSVDHFIIDAPAFTTSLRTCLKALANTKEVTLLCNHSKTYDSNAGYVGISHAGRLRAYIEKPDKEAWEEFCGKGQTCKDTAMMVTSRYALRQTLLGLDTTFAQQAQGVLASTRQQLDKAFLALPFMDIREGCLSLSPDVDVAFVEGDFIDVGRFASLYQINPKDKNNNVTMGHVVLHEEAKGNFIVNRHPQPLVVIHTSDSVIVAGTDGTVVAPMSDINAIGEIYKTQLR